MEKILAWNVLATNTEQHHLEMPFRSASIWWAGQTKPSVWKHPRMVFSGNCLQKQKPSLTFIVFWVFSWSLGNHLHNYPKRWYSPHFPIPEMLCNPYSKQQPKGKDASSKPDLVGLQHSWQTNIYLSCLWGQVWWAESVWQTYKKWWNSLCGSLTPRGLSPSDI